MSKFTSTTEIFQAVAAKKLSPEQAVIEMAALTQKPLTLKVSEKGGLSIYGLQRMPVTLYVQQWGRLLGEADRIRKFLDENKDKLKVKVAV